MIFMTLFMIFGQISKCKWTQKLFQNTWTWKWCSSLAYFKADKRRRTRTIRSVHGSWSWLFPWTKGHRRTGPFLGRDHMTLNSAKLQFLINRLFTKTNLFTRLWRFDGDHKWLKNVSGIRGIFLNFQNKNFLIPQVNIFFLWEPKSTQMKIISKNSLVDLGVTLMLPPMNHSHDITWVILTLGGTSEHDFSLKWWKRINSNKLWMSGHNFLYLHWWKKILLNGKSTQLTQNSI